MNPIVKVIITAVLIVIISEVAKINDKVGALIASLPFVTILAMSWLFFEKQGTEKIANHAYYTFWYVLPTLPMFLLIPWMLRQGVHFSLALLAGMLLTIVSFIVMALIAKRFGVDLLP